MTQNQFVDLNNENNIFWFWVKTGHKILLFRYYCCCLAWESYDEVLVMMSHM